MSAGRQFGHIVTKETRAKLSRALAGTHSSPRTEFRAGLVPHNKGTSQRITQRCEVCSQEFKSHRIRGGRFCSQACYHSVNNGAAHPSWRGGKPVLMKNGYLMNKAVNKYEHTILAERALGRSLANGELVHHINCIKTDNRPGNLLICSQAYHRWLHGEMSRRYALEHFTHNTCTVSAGG